MEVKALETLELGHVFRAPMGESQRSKFKRPALRVLEAATDAQANIPQVWHGPPKKVGAEL